MSSTAPPIIGIPTQTLEAIPGEVPRAWVMGQRYVHTITEAGGLPWLLPLWSSDETVLRQTYEKLDGLFLAGGVDVDPSSYGAAKEEVCLKTDLDRDFTEQTLIRWAREDGKPVLGVCRGIQIINVAFGGTLFQDLTANREGSIKHDYFPEQGFERNCLSHTTQIDRDSRLGDILKLEDLQVNSMHHQGIDKLAPIFRATAYAPDGLIEALECPNGQFLIGVQWHPEELTRTDEPSRRLFDTFIEQARQFRSPSLLPQ